MNISHLENGTQVYILNCTSMKPVKNGTHYIVYHPGGVTIIKAIDFISADAS